nr:ankyrin repeat and KH domain containing protein [Hymenolepis microstoma]
MKDLGKSEESLCFQKKNDDNGDDNDDKGREEDREGPSVVTEAGEDSDDEQSAFQDPLLETDKRKVRRLKRKKRETEFTLESSEEERETMKHMSYSTNTSGAESTPEELSAEASEPSDPIFDAIIEAVRNEKFDYAMELLRSYDKNVDSQVKRNKKGANDLDLTNEGSIIYVAAKGLPEAMHDLLRNGADPLEVNYGGNTALHWAAARGHLECVNILIEQGVPLDPLNECKQTPLMLAAQNGHKDVVSLLLELGASRDFEINQFGDSPLTLACFKEREDVIHILLNSKQRPIGKSELNSALSRSALRGSPAVAELLFEKGADVNFHGDGVIPPLHAAIFGGNAVMVDLLIARGADLEIPNRGGYRPLMEAVRRGYREIAESLLLAGATVESVSKTDQEITALSLAIDSGHNRLLVLLEKFRALENLD